jgi:hypothetical protein
LKNINQIQEACALIGVLAQHDGDEGVLAGLQLQFEALSWVLEMDSPMDGLLYLGRRFLASTGEGGPAVLVYAAGPDASMLPADAPRWVYKPEDYEPLPPPRKGRMQ